MAIATQSRDGILIIQVKDPRLVDEVVLEQLEKDVLGAIDQSEAERVIIDFTPVQFMSSSMLGKLVKIHKKCKEYKAKLKLSGVTPDIREVFKITRLDKLFDFEKDLESARKAYLKRGLFG
ncbi:putative anti-sigma factor antagonist BtrV [Posidoniimonas polymericola]|uniref:Anti-sigma factor antagonist n=1 Tax=Posidoniimonas polymericola TaxID=2528002 RepID=A0A5C5YMH0_9BACT|nr:STAS domain-containing protein [Posidoniimonas polymericola]TWT76029.1 putative anti-sigma factor antagonist BtrV [Posidoniimonas polymericola]